jgi:Tol biopolymer transport system component
MAPEQLEGKEADARSDIFAFGAVLYEMATGRKAFEGQSQASLIVSIMSASPPSIASLQPMTPPALERVVRTCLAKDPDARYQSAHDLKLQLEWVAEGGSQAGLPAPVAAGRRRRKGLVAAAAIAGWILAAGAIVWIVLSARRAEDTGRPFRVELVAPADMNLLDVAAGAIALAPEGSGLAFLAAPGSGRASLGVRDFATGDARLLEGTEGAEFPFWSADGRWIAFFAEGKLRKVQASGGPVTTLCEAHAGRGGTWNRAGEIVFAPDITGPLFRVPEDGGAPAQLTRPKDDKWTHRMPSFLPDGKHFVFIERESNDDPFGHISVGSIDGGETRKLVDQGSNPQFADGYLFFCRDGNLVAQRLRPGSLQLEGAIIPMFRDIEYYNPRDIGNFSVSQNGLLVYRQRQSVETRLAWFDRSGRELEVLGEPGFYAQTRLSRDGRKAAIVREDAAGTNRDVWTMDLERQQISRSTFVSTTGTIAAVFSPDGEHLVVSSSSGTGWNSKAVWIQPVSGSRVERKLLASTRFSVDDWAPDGSVLIGDSQEASTGHNVNLLRLDAADPKVAPLLASKFDEQDARFSPDGRWIAYNSEESGKSEVYLTDFPGALRKWQLSQGSGTGPVWSKDGREVYFSGNDGVMAVTVGAGDSPEIGKPARLDFPRQGLASGVIAGDGKRFLMLRYAKPPAPQPVRLIRNWRSVLEK